MLFFILVIVFLSAAAASWLLLRVLTDGRARLEARLRRVLSGGGAGALAPRVGEQTIVATSRFAGAPTPAASVKRQDGSLGRLTALARPFTKGLETRDRVRRIEQELGRAGIPLRASEYLAMRLLAVVGLALVGFILTAPLGLFVGGVVGFLAPQMYVKMKIQGRLKAFDSQIGDALVMMSNALKAGYSFLQSMELIAQEMAPPISEEFSRTLREMNLGADTEAALQSMATRVGSDDLDLVMTAVLIQRQVGGNLSEVLDNIALTIRERVRIRGEIQTLTAQGRISGVIIGLLPVGIFLFLSVINPSYMMLLVTHPLGQVMIGIALTGQLIGAMVIRKIIRIEV